MNFTLKPKEVKSLLDLITRVAKGKAIVPISTALKLETAGDCVMASVTDLDTYLQVNMPAEVASEGVAVVANAVRFAQMLTVTDTCRIATEGSKIKCLLPRTTFTLTSLNPMDYPMEPQWPNDGVPITTHELASAIHSAVHVAKNASEYHLDAVFIVCDEGRTEIITLDGRRCNYHRLPLDLHHQGPIALSTKSATILAEILAHEECKIRIFDSHMTVVGNSFRLKLVLSTISPPNYTHLLGLLSACPHSTTIQRDDFLQSLKQVTVATETPNTPVLITLHENTMRLKTESSICTATTQLDVPALEEETINETTIILAENYLFDMITQTYGNSKTIRISWNNPSSDPIYFTDPERENTIGCIMPMVIES